MSWWGLVVSYFVSYYVCDLYRPVLMRWCLHICGSLWFGDCDFALTCWTCTYCGWMRIKVVLLLIHSLPCLSWAATNLSPALTLRLTCDRIRVTKSFVQLFFLCVASPANTKHFNNISERASDYYKTFPENVSQMLLKYCVKMLNVLIIFCKLSATPYSSVFKMFWKHHMVKCLKIVIECFTIMFAVKVSLI